ncbi:carbohydrate sulfotransferase 14-like isoform X2 [Penaeus monodon]|uniref:carbohydrate sulfotransferase 14-like isoform X2 n=1 Tax=Penaeus monodon TaxID=6687 RepID=UPI0018A702B4|nr:carbohydrate sulfotransferase 14-like isoform X2 [Penaeus monodon]
MPFLEGMASATVGSDNTLWDSVTTATTGAEEPWNGNAERRMTERRESVRSHCGQVGKYPYSVRVTSQRSLYYSGKYDLLVCVTAKSGASTWKTHLLRMKGVDDPIIRNPHSLKYSTMIHALTQLGYVNLQQKLKSPSATRVMTARHPLSRLVSAYRDKFRDGQAPPGYRWGALIRQYCGDCKDNNGTLPFPQFLKLVLAEKADKGLINLNRHWRPYSSICSPCAIQYDYILKQETFDDDLHYVTEQLDLREVELGTRNNNKSNRTHLPTYLDYYDDVPSEVLGRIFKLYETDFRIFDYEIPQSLLDRVKH